MSEKRKNEIFWLLSHISINSVFVNSFLEWKKIIRNVFICSICYTQCMKFKGTGHFWSHLEIPNTKIACNRKEDTLFKSFFSIIRVYGNGSHHFALFRSSFRFHSFQRLLCDDSKLFWKYDGDDNISRYEIVIILKPFDGKIIIYNCIAVFELEQNEKKRINEIIRWMEMFLNIKNAIRISGFDAAFNYHSDIFIMWYLEFAPKFIQRFC